MSSNILHRYKGLTLLACLLLLLSLAAGLAHWSTAAGICLSCALGMGALRLALSPAMRQYAFTLFIMVMVVLALFFPHCFIELGDYPLKKLIVPLLQIIMLGVGCSLKLGDFRRMLAPEGRKAISIGVAGQFLIMPLVAFSLAKLFGFSKEVSAGMILVGCMPGGTASNVMAYLSKANVSLSVTMTSISTLLSPLMTPALMYWLGKEFIEVDFLAMFLDIVKMVILPVCAGLVVNHFLACRLRWLIRLMPLVSMLGIALIILIVTAAGRNSLLNVGLLLLLALICHMAMGTLLGYGCGRLFKLPERDCRTIALEVGMQNSGLASGFAMQMGKLATVGLAPAVFSPLMNILFSILSALWGRIRPKQEH